MTDQEYSLLLRQSGNDEYKNLLSQFGPSAADKEGARNMAFMRAGLGILAANAPSATPKSTLGILAQGGLHGLSGYSTDLKERTDERKASSLMALQAMKMKKDMAAQDALKNFYGAPSGPTPGVQALTAGATEGDVGPTLTNLKRLDAIEANPPTRTPPNFEQLIQAGVPAETVKAMIEAWKVQNPEHQVHGGYAYNPRNIQPGFLPQVKLTDDGKGVGVTPSPGGGLPSISALPGSLPTYTDFQLAGEGAKAQFDLVTVPDGKGGTLMLPRSIAAQRMGGGVSPQAPQPSPQSLPLPRPPSAPTAVSTGPLGYQAPESIRAADRELAVGRSKDSLDRSIKFRNGWSAASDRLGQLDLVETLMGDPNVASGAAAESISSLKGLADSLGIDVKGKNAEDVIAAVTGEMALKMRLQGGENLMPGQMSNFEQQLLRSMSPGLAQSREGRMLLTQVFKAKAARDMQLAEMAAEYEDKHGKLDAGFDREARAFVKANPMFDKPTVEGMIAQAKTLSGKGPKTVGAPKMGEVVDGYEFVGGDPAKKTSWRKR